MQRKLLYVQNGKTHSINGRGRNKRPKTSTLSLRRSALHWPWKSTQLKKLPRARSAPC